MSLSPAGDPHPGTITFDDRIKGTVEERPATGVPDSIAWEEREGTWVPVTRIEITGDGQAMRITSFDTDDNVLSSTTRHRGR